MRAGLFLRLVRTPWCSGVGSEAEKGTVPFSLRLLCSEDLKMLTPALVSLTALISSKFILTVTIVLSVLALTFLGLGLYWGARMNSEKKGE